MSRINKMQNAPSSLQVDPLEHSVFANVHLISSHKVKCSAFNRLFLADSEGIMTFDFDHSLDETARTRSRLNLTTAGVQQCLYKLHLQDHGRHMFSDVYSSGQGHLHWSRTYYHQKVVHPNLYKLAVAFLCTPASSVLCERIFSKAAGIWCKKGNCLTPNTVEKFIFLNKNESNCSLSLFSCCISINK